MNLRDEIENIKADGYSEANAESKLCQDIDLDFIRYSISDDSIRRFIERLNCLAGLKISISGDITELNHQDYKGKRISLRVEDEDALKNVSSMDEVVNRVNRIFTNKRYLQEVEKSGKNWIGVPTEEVSALDF